MEYIYLLACQNSAGLIKMPERSFLPAPEIAKLLL